MLSSETRCGIPPSPLPIPSLPSVLFTCLHLISVQNGLTPLEVARAKQDDDEVKEKRQQWWSRYTYHSYEDYGKVIDLLGGYSEEPAALPSHDVSRLTAADTHDLVILD